MTLHVEPFGSVLRWYEGTDGFDEHRPFEAVGMMLHLTRDSVFVFALHGKMTRQSRAELRDHLYARGIRKILADRHGRLRIWDLDFEISR